MTKKSNTTNPNPINRRQALTGAGATAGVMALAGAALADVPKPDRLATLIDQYYAEEDVFNDTAHQTDEESNTHADETFEKTIVEMTGVPATTAAGALAALAFIEREMIEPYHPCDFHDAIRSLLRAVRGYIEHGGAS